LAVAREPAAIDRPDPPRARDDGPLELGLLAAKARNP
jgi:hypothetical protein